MPQTAAYYGTNDASRLRTAARNAARTSRLHAWQLRIRPDLFGAVPGFQWSGLGFVGSPGSWIRATSSVGVSAHELGHNLGLNHANFWDTANAGVIGRGSSVEYGDKFDTMGSANAGSKHFNARYKNYLNWLTSADVQTVTTMARIASSRTMTRRPGHSRAARCPQLKHQLLGRAAPALHRQQVARGRRRRALGLWRESKQPVAGQHAGTVAGKDDSAVLIGRTSRTRGRDLHHPGRQGRDHARGVRHRGEQGQVPRERAADRAHDRLRDQHRRQWFVEFQRAGDGCQWRRAGLLLGFGDDSWGTNGPTASHRWTAAGEYVVRCIVTDMKGGEASDSVVVRVGNPSTFRLPGGRSRLRASPSKARGCLSPPRG